jgi:hypothetical protein
MDVRLIAYNRNPNRNMHTHSHVRNHGLTSPCSPCWLVAGYAPTAAISGSLRDQQRDACPCDEDALLAHQPLLRLQPPLPVHQGVRLRGAGSGGHGVAIRVGVLCPSRCPLHCATSCCPVGTAGRPLSASLVDVRALLAVSSALRAATSNILSTTSCCTHSYHLFSVGGRRR